MRHVGVPLQIPELAITPDPTGGVEISDNLQQTLALMTAFWRNQRIVLKASPLGALFVTSPQVKEVFHVTADGDNDTYKGENIPCSEVMVMGHPSNVGNVWVKPHATATNANAWPLAKSEVINLGLTNMSMLNLLIESDTEKAIIAYTQ